MGEKDFRFLAALGITMALSGHVREMKMAESTPSIPVDSRFRGNDGVGRSESLWPLQGHIREMKMAGLLVPVDSRFRGNDGVGLPSIFIAMTGWAVGMAGWYLE